MVVHIPAEIWEADLNCAGIAACCNFFVFLHNQPCFTLHSADDRNLRFICRLKSFVLLISVIFLHVQMSRFGSRASALLILAAGLAGALKRLEPKDGIVLHGGGSGDEDFRPYASYMAAAAPSVYMTYLGVDSLNNTANGTVASWFTDFNSTLHSYGSDDEYYLVPQIGLALPHDGKEERIANGSLDNALFALVTGLRALNRPVYLRIGYEFNGPWNGYKPTSYKAAFRRIVQFLRADALVGAQTAAVWDATCD